MKTINVVAAIIRSGDHILATQRGYGDWKDFWEFPGGKIEAGESPEAALVREIREEMATEIAIDRFVCTVEYDYPDFHLTMHNYLCHFCSDEWSLLEHEASRWLEISQLDSVQWLPADRLILPELEKLKPGV